MSWDEVLADYDAEHAANERAESAWFSAQRSLACAIETAARAIDEDKRRFDHQRRIRKNAIETAISLLQLNKGPIRRSRTFDELLETLERILLPVSGIGELFCYDSAVRIGAYLGLRPERVYLHAGTRKGARLLGLPYRQRSLMITQLPVPLQARSACEIENILCIYAALFGGVSLTTTSRC